MKEHLSVFPEAAPLTSEASVRKFVILVGVVMTETVMATGAKNLQASSEVPIPCFVQKTT